jgi:hypothetical protein
MVCQQPTPTHELRARPLNFGGNLLGMAEIATMLCGCSPRIWLHKRAGHHHGHNHASTIIMGVLSWPPRTLGGGWAAGLCAGWDMCELAQLGGGGAPWRHVPAHATKLEGPWHPTLDAWPCCAAPARFPWLVLVYGRRPRPQPLGGVGNPPNSCAGARPSALAPQPPQRNYTAAKHICCAHTQSENGPILLGTRTHTPPP